MPRQLGRIAVRIVVYTIIGLGPLYAGRLLFAGFLGTSDPNWLSTSSLAIEWTAFTMLAAVFGWTLTALALDHEEFWPLPGRTHAFRRLAGAPQAPAALASFLSAAGEDLSPALSFKALRARGVDLRSVEPWHRVYAAVRGVWLAAQLATGLLLIDLVRRIVAAEAGAPAVAIAAAGVLGVVTLTSWICHRLGDGVARRVAAALNVAVA